MDAGLDVRLGDDEGFRQFQECADFGRHGDEFAAAPQHAHGGIAQQAETRTFDRIGGGVARRQAIFAHAQEGEIVARHPVEESHRLVDLVGGKRRRMKPVALDDRRRPAPAWPGNHAPRPPRPRGRAAWPRQGAARASGSSMRGKVDVDEALAPHARFGGLSGLQGLAEEAHESRRLHRARPRGSGGPRGGARNLRRRSRRASN